MAGVRPERIPPGPGQESVWDYPRPPRIEPVADRVRVLFGGLVVADSTSALRVLETSQAPAIYVPPSDVVMSALSRTATSSFCEWKGSATYWTLKVGVAESVDAAWSYESPTEGFEAISGHLSFYPARVDEAWIGPHRATAHPGGFYGGWITPNVVGPFKGGPGTQGW